MKIKIFLYIFLSLNMILFFMGRVLWVYLYYYLVTELYTLGV